MRDVEIAAIQMDANPAPTAERLARADRLIAEAAEGGAHLAVLPELFNAGYAYVESNYRRAELSNGPTVTWMRETASRLGVHLAGSLMLRDRRDIYNALLLFAPDGRMWRYDKLCPWGWERAYFRKGHGITVADTDLGRIGMMICWDVGHPALWRRYAGCVDLILASSCPPDVTRPVYHLANGDQLTVDQLGPVMASVWDTARLAFGDTVDEQTAWLRVPTVNSGGAGQLRLNILHGTVLVLALLPQAPRLVRHLAQSSRMQISCGLVPSCKILDATGQPVAELTQEQGEAYVLAEVSLAGRRQSPVGPQPPRRLPPVAYLLSDLLLPALCILDYRHGLRQNQVLT